nr:flavin-containing monooxygenase FMO GS-OX-like 4 [Ipomoea batatas]
MFHLHPNPMRPITSKNVAVIGAGAAGLVAARELRREGHGVVVFERESQLGGTWVYTSAVESDPLGLEPCREVVNSSLYASLRTNLPREVMGFLDFPFVDTKKARRDPRRFPGHREVLEYLRDFAGEFRVTEMVRFSTEVRYVGLVGDGKWKVRSIKRGGSGGGGAADVDEVYDAVVVCNGHYTEPRIAEIPGMDVWPREQIHSHNYRVPDGFKDKVVVVIGASASAEDISREIAKVAKEVHIASRSFQTGSSAKLLGYENVWRHPMVDALSTDGGVNFPDGIVIYADAILHCTGYKYHFPFLETGGVVSVDDNRVGPLYKHVFPPALAPGLSFVGLPWKVVPFILCELQSKWIARVLSGRVCLPPEEEMMADIETLYSDMEKHGTLKRYTHRVGEHQFEYDDWLAARCDFPPIEEWRKEMYFGTGLRKRGQPETYRDLWDDEHLISQANEDFMRYIPKVPITKL